MQTTTTTRKLSTITPNETILTVFPIDQFTLEGVQASIQDNGLLNEILVGQDGVIVDGHTRALALANLNKGKDVEVPVKVMDIDGNSDEAVEFAIRLQIGRRNLTTKQKLEKASLILLKYPKKSDRQIARMIGISPTTVGNIRKALKDGGKITESLEGEREGVTKEGKTKTVKTRNISKAGKAKAAKKLPSTITTEPELTLAEVKEMAHNVDQLNAIRSWINLLGKYLASNPEPVSKEKEKAEKAAQKQREKEEREAQKREEKAEKLRKELADLEAGKTTAKKAPAKKAAKKAAKRGRK